MKKITKIEIIRDSDFEIMVFFRNGKKKNFDNDFITSTNSIDEVLDLISDVLYEGSQISAGTIGENYKLVFNQTSKGD
jgi:hypothetical protein